MAEDPNIDYENEDFKFIIFKDDGEEIDLIKNGNNTKVTSENRLQYANRVAKYYLWKESQHEINEFIKGFY